MQATNCRRWKWACALLGLALIGTNLWWAYGALDEAVTLTYQQQGFADTAADLERLARLLPGRIERKDLVALLRRHEPDAFIADNSEGVAVGFLRFTFDAQGRLTGIAHFALPGGRVP